MDGHGLLPTLAALYASDSERVVITHRAGGVVGLTRVGLNIAKRCSICVGWMNTKISRRETAGSGEVPRVLVQTAAQP